MCTSSPVPDQRTPAALDELLELASRVVDSQRPCFPSVLHSILHQSLCELDIEAGVGSEPHATSAWLMFILRGLPGTFRHSSLLFVPFR